MESDGIREGLLGIQAPLHVNIALYSGSGTTMPYRKRNKAYTTFKGYMILKYHSMVCVGLSLAYKHIYSINKNHVVWAQTLHFGHHRLFFALKKVGKGML